MIYTIIWNHLAERFCVRYRFHHFPTKKALTGDIPQYNATHYYVNRDRTEFDHCGRNAVVGVTSAGLSTPVSGFRVSPCIEAWFNDPLHNLGSAPHFPTHFPYTDVRCERMIISINSNSHPLLETTIYRPTGTYGSNPAQAYTPVQCLPSAPINQNLWGRKYHKTKN